MLKTDTLPLKYHMISRSMHWLMAFLFALMFCLGWGRELVSDNMRQEMMDLHKILGLLLLLILLPLRVLFRCLLKSPGKILGLPVWQSFFAKVIHGALYFMMVVMPLSGWLMVSAFGKKVKVFNYFEIDALIETNKTLAAILKDWHESLAWVFVMIIFLHVSAAVYHWLIRKDDVLRRMI